VQIALGCDHRGLEMKQAIIGLLKELGHGYKDFGTFSSDSVDYPDIARVVAEAVANGEFEQGILICASGIGMCIAANKVRGIRAALCCGTFGADRARRHNDANVLCLGQDAMELTSALDIVKVYLTTSFEGGRHQRRIDEIRTIEAS
jgi:ribose 5-phosphate isomerase B